MTSFVHRPARPSSARLRLILGATLALLAAALCWVLFASSTATSSAHGRPAGPAVAKSAQRVEVIVQLKKGVDVSRGRALVRSLGGRPGRDLPIINGLSARLSAAAAHRLALSPLIHAVSLNAAIRETALVNFDPSGMATSFNQSIGATRLWNRTTGRGVGVAVLDTGISGDRPDFRASQGDSTSRVVSSAVVDPNATTAADSYGHGTAVAGLVAGNGGYRDNGDPLWGQYAGSAPDANLVSVKISNDVGQATTLDAIYGLQFVVDHKSDYNIRVVNLSFRSTSAESYTTDPLDAAVEQAWFDGITVVAAAGNLGSASDAVSYAPGNDPYAISVGAVDTHGSTWQVDDVTPSWSSKGVTQDGVSKPDVLAPGAHLVSTLAPDSAFATQCSSCVVGGAYFQASGTSLAAPIVAGVAADLVAVHPDWTPNMVKGAIVNTAVRLWHGGSEVNATRASWAGGGQLAANQNLTPNQLINPNTGAIDYNTASWTAGQWAPSTDPLTASWTTASWTCQSCSSTGSSDVSPSTASWTGLGWATFWG